MVPVCQKLPFSDFFFFFLSFFFPACVFRVKPLTIRFFSYNVLSPELEI